MVGVDQPGVLGAPGRAQNAWARTQVMQPGDGFALFDTALGLHRLKVAIEVLLAGPALENEEFRLSPARDHHAFVPYGGNCSRGIGVTNHDHREQQHQSWENAHHTWGQHCFA